MAQVINTNSLSLLTQNNLNKSQSSLGTAIERLSSGLRINSAKDDAACQAIVNRFTANIKGLSQAARNANDGISIAQTTEGALNEINNNLQRVRELSIQAANGSNSKSDLTSIQDEITQRLAEINRVSEQIQFNGVKVLAEDTKLSIQVGANDGETISVSLSKITSATLGLANLDATKQLASKDLLAVTGNISEKVDPTTVKLSYDNAQATPTLEVATAGTDAGKLVAKVGSDYYAATYDKAANTVTYNTTTKLEAAAVSATKADIGTTFIGADGDVIELADIAAGDKAAKHVNTDPAATATFELYRKDADNTYMAVGSDGATYKAATVDLATGKVTLGTKDASATATTGYTKATSGNVLTVPSSSAVTADLSGVTADHAGTNTLLSRTVKNDDGTTSTGYVVKNVASTGAEPKYFNATVAADGKVTATDEVFVDPMNAIDSALQKVDTLRSSLGAVQNRFDSAITNLNNTVNNMSAARSRIEDTDYATEVSNMSKNQILQQAGTSVLAQANQVPQTVLSLLR